MFTRAEGGKVEVEEVLCWTLVHTTQSHAASYIRLSNK